ncbi:hypothetical protein LGK97_18765 [Clostridium sp. CS001]|uniref:hypothetical protein n=1 Tax=Clostridium sp. CS001 TaxID=2880648 RepID=UPI001CF1B6CE|nr:hypothetical protein [Clostridium sp. CS001]MCB2291757.1 hypothetical protein [Clostridium sp. CS001]
MKTKIITLCLISLLTVHDNFVASAVQVSQNNKNICIANTSKPSYKLVASLLDKNIKLFALSSLNNDIYDEFLLDVNGKTRGFHWQNVTAIPFAPQLNLSDLNNDNGDELSIILTTGTGSDLHLEDIHILDPITLNEYPITDHLALINEQVNSQITKNDKNVLIRIKLKGNEYLITKNISDAGYWFDNVYFGNSIHWRITNNKIYADVDAQVSPSGFVGTVTIEYKYENAKFILSNISFDEAEQM